MATTLTLTVEYDHFLIIAHTNIGFSYLLWPYLARKRWLHRKIKRIFLGFEIERWYCDLTPGTLPMQRKFGLSYIVSGKSSFSIKLVIKYMYVTGYLSGNSYWTFYYLHLWQIDWKKNKTIQGIKIYGIFINTPDLLPEKMLKMINFCRKQFCLNDLR